MPSHRAALLAALLCALPASAQYGLPGYTVGKRYLVTHTAANAATLTDFQVQVSINTAAEISAGRMKADCSDLRVFAGDGCSPTTAVAFWVADGTCNTATTTVWLGLPQITAGTTTSLSMFWGNPAATSVSNGPAVFPLFFDDFNSGVLDPNKWNRFGAAYQTLSGGKITAGGGGSAIWTKDTTVLKAGQTVFGVRTDAQSAGGADIEYGAAFVTATASSTNIHWSSRTWTGVTWMSYDYSFTGVGTGSAPGVCQYYNNVGDRWANPPGVSTYFQTEFFYELNGNNTTTFGIYNKQGIKQSSTMGFAGCLPPAQNSAYWQWDHATDAPNPTSSVDYAYVRKYANPDPVVISTGIDVAASTCVVNGSGPCTTTNQGSVCQSGKCSPNASVCIPNVAGSCYADADCNSGQYCHRSTYACTTKLVLGTQLPADGLHDTCPGSSTSNACQSGKCNQALDTCAGDNGVACPHGAADCVTNICASDNICGYGGDEGTCTSSDASLCRSGRCKTDQSGCLSPTGCLTDVECAGSTFCADPAYACQSKLSNGTTVGQGHGTCGGPAGPFGSAVTSCASGQCNLLENTCSGPNGSATCAVNAECTSNACGSDGTCGITNGSGPCSPGADPACRSGECSAGGSVCIPATSGSCYTDSDCGGPALFCFRSSFSCTATLAAGVNLPADSLHDTCPASEVSAACTSGLCSTLSNKCALSNSALCTAGDQCLAGACDSDGSCGYANGHGPCDMTSQARVCRSGICGVGNLCIPAGGCAVDGDCDGSHYCESSLSCDSLIANGVTIPVSHGTCGGSSGPQGAPARACLSNACNVTQNTCAGANATTACTSASECVSNVCGSNGFCGSVNGEGSCTPGNATSCQSGTCSANASVCVPAASNSCYVDNDCASTDYCDRAAFTCRPQLVAGTALPTDGLHNTCPASALNAACVSGQCNVTAGTCATTNATACTATNQCVSNICAADGLCGLPLGEGPCTQGTQLEVCRSGVCASGRCVPPAGCGSDADCVTSAEFCDSTDFGCHLKRANGATIAANHGVCGGADGTFGAAVNVCASGACNVAENTCAGPNTSTACTTASECVSDVCGNNGFCGRSDGENGCIVATGATVCQSGVCSTHGGACVPSGPGKCWVDADCPGTQFCHRDTFTCTDGLSAGTALPMDGLHGTCAASTVNRACASGHCNPTTGTCAGTNNASCTTAAQCTVNVCGADGKCGYDTAAGPCNNGTAVPECRSGYCASHICIPGPGCGTDADCAATEYCSSATYSCVPKLGNGFAVPADHGGCGGSSGALGAPSTVCASGNCNEVTNTCAGENVKTGCTAASECTSNICGSTGQCGFIDGEGSCTTETAGRVCQSGACSVSGVCKPSSGGRCAVDNDCAFTEQCVTAELTCHRRAEFVRLGGGGCTGATSLDFSWLAALTAALTFVRRKRAARGTALTSSD